MGDNRNVSGDSRDPSVGPIPYEKVVGRTIAVLWPLDDAGPSTIYATRSQKSALKALFEVHRASWRSVSCCAGSLSRQRASRCHFAPYMPPQNDGLKAFCYNIPMSLYDTYLSDKLFFVKARRRTVNRLTVGKPA
jgi:hypothetical protein